MTLTPERLAELALVADEYDMLTYSSFVAGLELKALLDMLADKDAEVERLRGVVAAAITSADDRERGSEARDIALNRYKDDRDTAWAACANATCEGADDMRSERDEASRAALRLRDERDELFEQISEVETILAPEWTHGMILPAALFADTTVRIAAIRDDPDSYHNDNEGEYTMSEKLCPFRKAVGELEVLLAAWDEYDAEGYAAGDGPDPYSRIEAIRVVLAKADK